MTVTNYYNIALALFSVFSFASFSWGVFFHFASESVPGKMRLVSNISIFLFVLLIGTILMTDVNSVKLAMGIGINLVASGLFYWAVWHSRRQRLSLAFDTDLPHFIITSGPYRIVRHPFYTSYLIFWFGMALTLDSTYLAVGAAILLALYVQAAKSEEEKFKNTFISADYQHYAKKTGFFFPLIGRAR